MLGKQRDGSRRARLVIVRPPIMRTAAARSRRRGRGLCHRTQKLRGLPRQLSARLNALLAPAADSSQSRLRSGTAAGFRRATSTLSTSSRAGFARAPACCRCGWGATARLCGGHEESRMKKETVHTERSTTDRPFQIALSINVSTSVGDLENTQKFFSVR